MAQPRVVFDGYSYEPPSYEECVGNGPPNNQSVYNPTVSHDTNFVGGFRPLYTPNGYNGLSEYKIARRRRRIRICCATFFGIFCFILLIMIVSTNINRIYHMSAGRGVSGVNHDWKNIDDLTSYKDSSIINNNDDYYREMKNENKQTEDTNNNVWDKIKDNQYSENSNVFTNDAFNKWQTDTQKFLERLKPKDNPAYSAEEKQNPKNNYSPFIDLDDLLKKQVEKLNFDKFDDNFANLGKEKQTSSNENPFNFGSQDELSKHKSVSTLLEDLIKKSEDMKQWMQRPNFSVNPTNATDMDLSTDKSPDEDVKMPDVSLDSSISNNNDDHERQITTDNKQTEDSNDIVLDKLLLQDDPEIKKVYDIIRSLRTDEKRKLDDTDEIISNHS